MKEDTSSSPVSTRLQIPQTPSDVATPTFSRSGRTCKKPTHYGNMTDSDQIYDPNDLPKKRVDAESDEEDGYEGKVADESDDEGVPEGEDGDEDDGDGKKKSKAGKKPRQGSKKEKKSTEKKVAKSAKVTKSKVLGKAAGSVKGKKEVQKKEAVKVEKKPITIGAPPKKIVGRPPKVIPAKTKDEPEDEKQDEDAGSETEDKVAEDERGPTDDEAKDDEGAPDEAEDSQSATSQAASPAPKPEISRGGGKSQLLVASSSKSKGTKAYASITSTQTITKKLTPLATKPGSSSSGKFKPLMVSKKLAKALLPPTKQTTDKTPATSSIKGKVKEAAKGSKTITASQKKIEEVTMPPASQNKRVVKTAETQVREEESDAQEEQALDDIVEEDEEDPEDAESHNEQSEDETSEQESGLALVPTHAPTSQRNTRSSSKTKTNRNSSASSSEEVEEEFLSATESQEKDEKPRTAIDRSNSPSTSYVASQASQQSIGTQASQPFPETQITAATQAIRSEEDDGSEDTESQESPTPRKRKLADTSNTPSPNKKKPAPADKLDGSQRARIIDSLVHPDYYNKLHFKSISDKDSAKLARHWREVLSPELRRHFSGQGGSQKVSGSKGTIDKEQRRQIWKLVCDNYEKANWKGIEEMTGMTTTKLKRHFRDVMKKDGEKYINKAG